MLEPEAGPRPTQLTATLSEIQTQESGRVPGGGMGAADSTRGGAASELKTKNPNNLAWKQTCGCVCVYMCASVCVCVCACVCVCVCI